MKAKQLVTLLIIAVIAVATIGIGFMFSQMDKGVEKIDIDAGLEVYGNANNDGRIDSKDIVLIEDIIADSKVISELPLDAVIDEGLKTLEKYPLADANCDGVVDEADIIQVQSIIDAEPTKRVKIYHINHSTAGNYIAETMYPIMSAVSTGATNSLLLFKYLSISSEIKGISYASKGLDWDLFYEFSTLKDETNLGIIEGQTISSKRMNPEVVSNLMDTEGVTALITADNASYVSNESIFENMGCDVIRIKPSAADPGEFISALLMTAFLFDTEGKGYMDICDDIIEWCENFLTEVDEKLKSITNKVNAVASSGDNRISTASSEYGKVLSIAGANYPLPDAIGSGSTVASFSPGAENWLLNYDIDYIISMRTSPESSSWYGGTVLTDTLSTVKGYFMQYSDLECYESDDVYVISGDMPVMLRIAYSAEIMYGDLFEGGWADSKHMEFAYNFMGFDKSDMEGKKFVLTKGDVGLS